MQYHTVNTVSMTWFEEWLSILDLKTDVQLGHAYSCIFVTSSLFILELATIADYWAGEYLFILVMSEEL
jgi:hypothetical protein